HSNLCADFSRQQRRTRLLRARQSGRNRCVRVSGGREFELRGAQQLSDGFAGTRGQNPPSRDLDCIRQGDGLRWWIKSARRHRLLEEHVRFIVSCSGHRIERKSLEYWKYSIYLRSQMGWKRRLRERDRAR